MTEEGWECQKEGRAGQKDGRAGPKEGRGMPEGEARQAAGTLPLPMGEGRG